MFMSKKPEQLKNIFNSLKTVATEATMTFTGDGLKVNFMTTDSSTCIIMQYFATNFNKYELKEQVRFKFITSYMADIMKQCKKDDTIFISFDETVSVMKITITDEGRKKSYELNLLELDEKDKEEKQVPELKYNHSATANNKLLLEMLDSMVFVKGGDSQYSSIDLSLSDKGIMVKEEDSKRGKSQFTLKDFSADGLIDSVSTKYAYKLLKTVVAFSNEFSDKSIYELEKDYPIRITTITPDIKLVCILAPIIVNEE